MASNSKQTEFYLLDYNPEKRYQGWKSNFDKGFQEIKKRILDRAEELGQENKDEISVELQNIQLKIEELEKQVNETSKDSHTNSLYFHIHESKIELLLQLDNIQFWNRDELKKDRKELCTRLHTLCTQLDSKIHGGSSNCQHCEEKIVIVPDLNRQ